MRQSWQGAILLALCIGVLGLVTVRAEDVAKGGTDETFVFKASAAGLAEVNLANIAVKQATNADVKKFAEHMITDHTKANKELIDLANKVKFTVAPRMDAEHQTLATRLAGLTGSDFDRTYMAGQVRDHEMAVTLFQDEAKNGTNDDLKKWAGKTLPTLRDHLKMAQDIQGKLKGDAKTTSK